jgi:hypothetical protein
VGGAGAVVRVIRHVRFRRVGFRPSLAKDYFKPESVKTSFGGSASPGRHWCAFPSGGGGMSGSTSSGRGPYLKGDVMGQLQTHALQQKSLTARRGNGANRYGAHSRSV